MLNTTGLNSEVPGTKLRGIGGSGGGKEVDFGFVWIHLLNLNYGIDGIVL
jgi:hypothetical protein